MGSCMNLGIGVTLWSNTVCILKCGHYIIEPNEYLGIAEKFSFKKIEFE